MKGKHKVIVSTKRLKYEFELRRNLTIIQGDSATGKTTLVDMIRDFVNNPTGTPVEVICDKKCHVVEGSLWKEQLSGISDCIVFIDEIDAIGKSRDNAMGSNDEREQTPVSYTHLTLPTNSRV
mgnify:CR=1 FL=1